MSLYYTDDAVTLHHGHALEVLRTLPDQSVNCVVTSPPYFGLRDYGTPDQIGLEESPAAYIAALRDVFAEARRVLADDGTLWVNIGDSYVRQKNLLGIPWRLAFALQDDGWILRNAIVWAKPNAMPESVTDRLSNRHELLFMFSRSRRYWFDLDPIREASATVPMRAADGRDRGGYDGANNSKGARAGVERYGHLNGRNPGDVWTIPTTPFPGAHFAVMAPELARRCVLAGCPEGGIVLDPFSGVGTTGMVATRNGRRYIGVDNNADTLALSLETRLAQGALIEGAS